MQLLCIKPMLKGPVLYTVFIYSFCVTEKGFVIKKNLGCRNKNLLEYVALTLYLLKEKGGKGYLQGLSIFWWLLWTVCSYLADFLRSRTFPGFFALGSPRFYAWNPWGFETFEVVFVILLVQTSEVKTPRGQVLDFIPKGDFHKV